MRSEFREEAGAGAINLGVRVKMVFIPKTLNEIPKGVMVKRTEGRPRRQGEVRE